MSNELSPPLDNNRNIFHSKEFGNKEKVEAANKFAAKISWKRIQAIEIAKQIECWLNAQAQKFGFQYDNQMTASIKLSGLEATKDIRLTAEAQNEYEDNKELRVMANRLRNTGTALGALFEKVEDGKLESKSQILAIQYSRHRLDPVWLYRKSQLIRKIYRAYFEETKVQEKYQLCHLVLTVPHKNGKFKGQKFYGDKLVKTFTQMRKLDFWKQNVAGGEYGMENTNGENGIHTHLHCLLFVEKNVDIQALNAEIHDNWLRLTTDNTGENDNSQRQVYLEPIYRYKRNESGQYEKQCVHKKIKTIPANEISQEEIEKNGYEVIKAEWGQDYIDSDGNVHWISLKDLRNDYYEYSEVVIESINHEQRVKEYITTETPDYERAILDGVLECVKYHFKGDTGAKKDKNGNLEYDMELLKEILNNTKGMRFYSRFGILYNVKSLNFNKLDNDKPEKLNISEIFDSETGNILKIDLETGEIISQEAEKEDETKDFEAELKGSIENIERNLINPFTLEAAKDKDLFDLEGKLIERKDFTLVFFKPEMIKYHHKKSKKAFESAKNTPESVYFRLEDRTLEDIPLILRNLSMGMYNNDINQLAA